MAPDNVESKPNNPNQLPAQKYQKLMADFATYQEQFMAWNNLPVTFGEEKPPEPQKPDSYSLSSALFEQYLNFYDKAHRINQSEENNPQKMTELVNNIDKKLPKKVNPEDAVLYRIAASQGILDVMFESNRPYDMNSIATVIEKCPEVLPLVSDNLGKIVDNLKASPELRIEAFKNPDYCKIINLLAGENSPLNESARRDAAFLSNEAAAFNLYSGLSQDNNGNLQKEDVATKIKQLLQESTELTQFLDSLQPIFAPQELLKFFAKISNSPLNTSEQQAQYQAYTLGAIRSFIYSIYTKTNYYDYTHNRLSDNAVGQLNGLGPVILELIGPDKTLFDFVSTSGKTITPDSNLAIELNSIYNDNTKNIRTDTNNKLFNDRHIETLSKQSQTTNNIQAATAADTIRYNEIADKVSNIGEYEKNQGLSAQFRQNPELLAIYKNLNRLYPAAFTEAQEKLDAYFAKNPDDALKEYAQRVLDSMNKISIDNISDFLVEQTKTKTPRKIFGIKVGDMNSTNLIYKLKPEFMQRGLEEVPENGGIDHFTTRDAYWIYQNLKT